MPSSRSGVPKPAGKMRMIESVLDASAIIAFLRGEAGADKVAPAIATSVASSVNVAEVVAWLSRGPMDEQEIRGAIDDLGLDIRAFDKEAAISTGLLWRATRARGISFGDRACLSLARQLDLPVLTADRAWAKLDVAVEVRLVR